MDVAEAPVINRNAVERHVIRVFTKLGVRKWIGAAIGGGAAHEQRGAQALVGRFNEEVINGRDLATLDTKPRQDILTHRWSTAGGTEAARRGALAAYGPVVAPWIAGPRSIASSRHRSIDMERRAVNPWTWQDAFGFVQANEVRDVSRVLVCSGQASTDAEGNPVHLGDMRAQCRQALENLEAVLGAGGFSLGDVVRLNYYTTDVDAFLEVSPAFNDHFARAGCRAASTLLGVTRLAFPGLMIELEATAIA